jgi:hypothetical protein
VLDLGPSSSSSAIWWWLSALPGLLARFPPTYSMCLILILKTKQFLYMHAKLGRAGSGPLESVPPFFERNNPLERVARSQLRILKEIRCQKVRFFIYLGISKSHDDGCGYSILSASVQTFFTNIQLYFIFYSHVDFDGHKHLAPLG